MPDLAQSQLPITYLRTDQMDAWMHDPVIPFEERLDAPVYVQSNCITPSRRDAIVGALMKFEDLGLKSYGRWAAKNPKPQLRVNVFQDPESPGTR